MRATENATSLLLEACRNFGSSGEAFTGMLKEGVSQPVLQELLGHALNHWGDNILDCGRGTRQVVAELIAAGANPLALTPFPVWKDLEFDATRTALPMRFLAIRHPDITVHMVNILAAHQHATGRQCLSEDGGNPLHVLVRQFPEWMGNMLDSHVNGSRLVLHLNQRASLPNTAHLHNDWVHQRNKDGATPLLALWQAVRDFHFDCPCADDFVVWDLSEYLRMLGAGIDARNLKGESVAALMVQAHENGVNPPERYLASPTWALIQATASALDLDATTPSNAQASRRRTL